MKPVSFTLGLAALQPPAAENSNGVLALAIGESTVSLQITCGGGVAALRALEGAIENPNGRPALLPDLVARESRITLGQLPAELRDAVKRIRIFGPRDLAQQLADEMELRFEPMGLSVEVVAAYKPDEFGVQLPPDASLSAAFSLAARLLAEQPPAFEFLPPKLTILEQFAAKYSSGRLRTTGAVAAGVVAIVCLAFLVQQIELWHYRSQWKGMAKKVAELQAVQAKIQQFQPWYDQTLPRPGDFAAAVAGVSRKRRRDGQDHPIQEGNAVSCSGNAQNNAALLAMQAKLSAADGVSNFKVGFDSRQGADAVHV